MGYQLRRWLADRLPSDLSSGERLVALEIADQADEETRLAYGKGLLAVVARRTGFASEKQVGKVLGKLAARGIELRVQIVKDGRPLFDGRGRPVFAYDGHETTYRIPTLEECPALVPFEGDQVVPREGDHSAVVSREGDHSAVVPQAGDQVVPREGDHSAVVPQAGDHSGPPGGGALGSGLPSGGPGGPPGGGPLGPVVPQEGDQVVPRAGDPSPKEGRRKEELPPPPTPSSKEQEEPSNDAHRKQAARFVATLPARLRPDETRRLIDLVAAAFARGWTAEQLGEHLLRNLDTARHRPAVWAARLAQLGDPPDDGEAYDSDLPPPGYVYRVEDVFA